MYKKILGIIVLIVAVFSVLILIKNKKRPSFKSTSINKKLKVLTTQVMPCREIYTIKTNGNTLPVWNTEITSEVTGKVTKVNSKVFVGESFNKGDVLIEIDPTQYEFELSQAKSQLAKAEQNLMDEKVRSAKALEDWKNVNPDKTATEYTLRKPQLKFAESEFQTAKARLKLANQKLARTQIKAPYQGYVKARDVDIGETVRIGEKLATVFSSTELEIKAQLNQQQIHLIENSEIVSILVYDSISGNKSWKAEYLRTEKLMDEQSRWRSVFLAIVGGEKRELPIAGSFLEIEIQLNLNQNLIKIAEQSISIDGSLWLIDKNNLLVKHKPEIVVKNEGFVYINPLKSYKYPLQFITYPSQSLLEGIEVDVEMPGSIDVN